VGFYTSAFFERWFDELDVAPEQRQRISAAIDDAAATWNDRRADRVSAEYLKARKAELTALAQASRAYGGTLATLSSASWAMMSMASDELNEIAPQAMSIASPEYVRRGQVSFEVNDGEGDKQILHLQTLQHVISHLASVADFAAQERTKLGKGPARDTPLETWIWSIANIWAQYLKRPFTRDLTSDGQPISLAARFCVEAYHCLDPLTPTSRVLNEMKKRIQLQNHLRARR
tara:strand:+ start:1426 stop:2121 length:696 start_codon:yes stop_codon:yes gene_type:complete